MTLVDTSAWIHGLRVDGDAVITRRVRELLQSGEAAWCAMIRLELWNGARGDHEKRVLREMERHVPDLEINADVWANACSLAAHVRKEGKSIPATDILIAACARHHGVPLEHADRHFEMLAGIDAT